MGSLYERYLDNQRRLHEELHPMPDPPGLDEEIAAILGMDVHSDEFKFWRYPGPYTKEQFDELKPEEQEKLAHPEYVDRFLQEAKERVEAVNRLFRE